MKRVLITGANSYVGTNVEKWLMKEPDKYYVETLNMKDPNWKDFDFSKFDVVFHVAGIAHVSTKKSMKDLYFKVNRDLAIETAVRAKESGVKHFIFMSSMIIYGKANRLGNRSKVDTNRCKPVSFYGKSKLEADLKIQELMDSYFKTCVIRTPVVFGYNSKGNFQKSVGYAKIMFLYPKYVDRKSMIYIDNLCIFVRWIIDEEFSGPIFPQNPDYLGLYDIVKFVRNQNGLKFRESRILLNVLMLFKSLSFIRRTFSDKYYNIDICKKYGCFDSLIKNDKCLINSIQSRKE